MQNWARNITFGTDRVHHPGSVDELRSTIAGTPRARVVGTAHCFNDLVDTDAHLISLERLDRVLAIDTDAATVTVEGGIRYHQLCTQLHTAGWALPNLPSIPHFSVVGACATGTHGSGDGNAELAAAVTSVELITAGGDFLTLQRSDPDFGAAVVSLGALGAVSRLTLDIEPSYRMAQELHLDTPLDLAIEELDSIMGSAYSVSWFLDWRTPVVNQIWRKHRLDTVEHTPPSTDDQILGGRRATAQLSPRGPEGAEAFTRQGMRQGPWLDVLPHVRIEAAAAPGAELQTEYFVSRADGPAALAALAELGPVMSPVMRMSEIRTVAADQRGPQWLSPFDEDRLALHLSWITDWPAVRSVLPLVEEALAPFQPRPHWGKLYELDPATIRRRYPHFEHFRAVADRLDPTGRFRNPHLDRLLG